MKKIILMFLFLLLCLPICYLKADVADPVPKTNENEELNKTTDNSTTEQKKEEKESEAEKTSSPINIKSKSAIIMEASTKKVLFEKDSKTAYAPASMTKIMTMLLVMEALDNKTISLTDQVTISKNAANMGGSQVYLEEGSVATVEELLTAVAIGSANDAAVALAEKLGGTEENFVAMMNKRARELGCTTAVFKNPHGLDEDGHVISAYDMALIATELVKYEDILKITGTYETTLTHQNGKSIWLVNTNSLIRFYSGLDGLKTGYTEKAGYCLTGTMKRNDMRLITVVMGAEEKEDRNTDTINMMEYAFSMFYKDTLLTKDKSLGTIFIDNSKQRKIKYYLEENANVVLSKDVREINYKYDIDLDEVKAPLKKGDKVGTLTLEADEETKEYKLIVNENVKETNYINRLINYLKDIISGNLNVLN